MNNFHRTLLLSLTLIFSTFNFYGCSTAEPPKAEIAQAEQIIDTAIKGRAARYAPSEFQLAQEKLNKARVEMERKNYVKARRLSEQARADAEYAIARAEEEYTPHDLIFRMEN